MMLCMEAVGMTALKAAAAMIPSLQALVMTQSSTRLVMILSKVVIQTVATIHLI